MGAKDLKSLLELLLKDSHIVHWLAIPIWNALAGNPRDRTVDKMSFSLSQDLLELLL